MGLDDILKHRDLLGALWTALKGRSGSEFAKMGHFSPLNYSNWRTIKDDGRDQSETNHLKTIMVDMIVKERKFWKKRYIDPTRWL